VFGRLEEFVWRRHRSFEIVPQCSSSGVHGDIWSFGRRIVANTDEYDSYQPIRDNPNLYRAFANLRDEAALFEFVKRYGALTEPGLTPSSKDPVFTSVIWMGDKKLNCEIVQVPGDEVALCLREAAWCAHVLRYQAERDVEFFNLIRPLETNPSMANLSIELDPLHGVRLVIEPTSLLVAIKLQLLEDISRGVNSIQCTYCGNWFARKAGAKFCNDKCKDTHHNMQKRLRQAEDGQA
jgi:glutaredoxin-related protein